MGTTVEEIEAQEWLHQQIQKLVQAIDEFEGHWHPDGQLMNTGRRTFTYEGACYEIILSTAETEPLLDNERSLTALGQLVADEVRKQQGAGHEIGLVTWTIEDADENPLTERGVRLDYAPMAYVMRASLD